MFDYTLGQSASLTRVFEGEEIAAFRALVGSVGAVDGDSRVPAGLVGALFSRLLGTSLPGRGTNWMKQTLRFHGPAHIGDELTASVEIVRLRADKRLINLRVCCWTSSRRLVCEGEALVLAKEMATR